MEEPKRGRGRPPKSDNKPTLFKIKNKKLFLEALETSNGILAPACKAISINRSTFYKYYENDEEFRLAVDEIRQNAVEFVENALLDQIKAKNTVATIFYLKCKGGWVDTQNIKVDATSEIRIKYILPEETKEEPIQIETPITITIKENNQ